MNICTSMRLLAAAAIAIISLDAQAAVFNVNTQADTNDGSCTAQHCTIREAIIAANNSAGLDTVNIPNGTYFMNLGGRGENQGLTGDFDITDDVDIVGAGGPLIIANGIDRIFDIRSTNGFGFENNVSITNVNMLGGNPGFDLGGAIENGGFLFLDRCQIINNTAEVGGGISQEIGAGLFILQTLIESNTANEYGGGIDNVGADMLIAASLVYNNNAGTEGGGVDNTDGFMELYASTITGNTANTGGGIENFDGTLLSESTTIVGNTANAGGGILQTQFATANVAAVLIANNNGGNCSASLDSFDYNLDSGQTCGFNQANDLNNTDPMLDTLQHAGGETMLFPLLDGSPAIDAGGPLCAMLDQRNANRPQDGDGDGNALCDIGAYEKEEGLPVFDAEVVGPSIRVGDINNDGIDDIATLYREEMGFDNVIYLNSGADGSLIRTQSTGSPEPIDMVLVPDANGDGIDDLGVLQTEGGVHQVWVQDMTNPNAGSDDIAVVTFASINIPIPGGLVAYRGTGGQSWIGVLGVRANGDVRLQVKRSDGVGGAQGNFQFAPSFPPEFIQMVPDITGDGIDDVAVLGIDASGNIRVQLKNGVTGALIHWIQYAKAFTPLQMIVIPNTDAGPAIGVLQTHPDGRVRIQVKYAATRMPVGTGAVNFARSFDPKFALAIPDKTGNGYSELVVFGIRNGMDVRAQMKDSVTKQSAGEVFFQKNIPPNSVYYLNDSNGNNVVELGLFGRNTNNMLLKGQVKDAQTKLELASYLIPPL